MSFCDTEISDYNVRNCGIDYAGVVGIGLISEDSYPTYENLEDPEFWVGVTSTSPLKYFAIRNTRGEYNGGEPIEEDDLIGKIVTGAVHSATIESTGMIENFSYWNAIQSKAWKLCIVTAGGLMYYIDNPVSIYTKVINNKSTKSQAFYQSEMKWQDFSNPIILNAPEGIFYGTEPIFGDGIFDYTFDITFN